MTLTSYPHVEQGSEGWMTLRRGIVTASTIGKLINARNLTAGEVDCPSCTALAGLPCTSKRDGSAIKTYHPERAAAARGTEPVLAVGDVDDLAWLLASERITGWTEESFTTEAMWRGIEDEPRAVAVYSAKYAPVQTMGFMVEDRYGCAIGYSPDGLVGADGLVEVKSRAPKTQVKTIVNAEVPAPNIAQLQCGLLVTGRDWIDYLSYAGGMHMWVQRVTPDPDWFDVIVTAARQLEQRITEIVATYNTNVEGLALTERVTELEMVI